MRIIPILLFLTIESVAVGQNVQDKESGLPKVYARVGLAGIVNNFVADDIEGLIDPLGLYISTGGFGSGIVAQIGLTTVLQLEYRSTSAGHDFTDSRFESGEIVTDNRFPMQVKSTELVGKLNLLYPFYRPQTMGVAVFAVGGLGQASYRNPEGLVAYKGSQIVVGGEVAVISRYWSASMGARYLPIEYDQLAISGSRFRSLPSNTSARSVAADVTFLVGLGF